MDLLGGNEAGDLSGVIGMMFGERECVRRGCGMLTTKRKRLCRGPIDAHRVKDVLAWNNSSYRSSSELCSWSSMVVWIIDKSLENSLIKEDEEQFPPGGANGSRLVHLPGSRW
ncbi:Hypothetical predicted protein [Xyrichtys novacula]|uniref:Uncharacterized protein n=1 Tax=Xyrichtys novacula TaxID=13765 RepID=A0AAV1FZR3_XYRNO|nr:Hypothetical predicted protein [Xyrichtys novacula]